MPLYDCLLLAKASVKKEDVMDLVGQRVYQRNGAITELKSFGTIQLGYGIRKLDGRHFQEPAAESFSLLYKAAEVLEQQVGGALVLSGALYRCLMGWTVGLDREGIPTKGRLLLDFNWRQSTVRTWMTSCN